MAQIRTTQGKNEVVTIIQDGTYSSRLYVNVGHSKGDFGDGTMVAAKHQSEVGARKWAAKVLAA